MGQAGRYVYRTPEEFAQELPRWREKWARDNPRYFPLEKRLTEKAQTVGYLDKADLVDITGVLGNPHGIGARVSKLNSDTEVREKTREAIALLGAPEAAFRAITGLARLWCAR